MRVHITRMKKLTSFVLLLAMAGTMVWSPNSYAAEAEEKPVVADSSTEKEIKDSETPGNAAGQTSADLKDKSENIDIADQTEQKQGNPTEKSSGVESYEFESTAPVIEKVELAQNKTAIKRDAQLSLSVYAYDDSEIVDIKVGMAIGTDENHLSSERYLMEYPASWNKVEGTNEYIGTYQLDGHTTGRLVITSIKVADEHGNKTTYDVRDNEGNKFWVDIEPLTKEAVNVESLEFSGNGQSVERINDLKDEMSLKLSKAIENDYVWLWFEKEGGGDYYEIGLPGVNKNAENDVFEGSDGRIIGSSFNLSSGKYTLKDIYIEQGCFDTKVSLVMKNQENYGFTLTKDVENKEEDVECKITSVELDKNGQKVEEGDTVNVTVGVSADDGVKLPEQGWVYFCAAAPNINKNEKSVILTLDASDHKYHGSFVVGDMYPCEWYINRIDIGSKGDYSYVKGLDYPYYILVYNGDSFVNPEFDLNIHFMALDENGRFVSVGSFNKKNVQRRQTLKEMGVTFPEKNSKYQGLTQVGWTDRLGREITDGTSVVDQNYMEIYAKYDKGVFRANFNYPDSKGEWITDSQIVTYEYGQTYGDLSENVSTFIPEDITKDYTFTNWECSYDLNHKENDVITETGNTYISFYPKFSGIVALGIFKHYFDERGGDHGTGRYGREFVAVKEGTKGSDIAGILKALELPKMYPGLRFKEWEILGNQSSEAVKNYDTYVMTAVYENCLVSYIINAYVFADEEGTIFGQVAEKGETVSALTEFEGFGEITWENAPDKEFVVNSHMKFWGTADIDPSDSNKPSKPSDSTSGSGNDTNVEPDSKLPIDVVDSTVKRVNEAKAGETVKIIMNSKTVVPKEVLEAAKGKDVSVVLEMEGYSWTINGKDIKATDLKDIDLRVIKNTNNIPSSTVQTLAGDNPCMQITLAHEGNFGFKATLNIGVGSEYAGKYGNLYYHDSAGKMVFINAGQINPGGDVSLAFSHASDYLLVMSDQKMSQTNVPGSLRPTGTDASQNGNGNTDIPTTNVSSNVSNANAGGNASKASDGDSAGKVRKSAKTGDYDAVYPWIFLCAAAMGVMAYISRRKRI